MDIQAEKIELVKLLLKTESTSVITAIKNIFKSEGEDFWNSLNESQVEEIEIGLAELGSGKMVDFEDVIRSYRS